MPTEFTFPCELAGLFHARTPRFSQLFFHDFYPRELETEAGQGYVGTVSRRSAEAYLKSGVRLESKCGISDVWYNYVKVNQALFRASGQPSRPEMLPPPRPHLEGNQLSYLWKTFQWKVQHSRPRPTKKRRTDGPRAVGVEQSAGVAFQERISEPGGRLGGRSATTGVHPTTVQIQGAPSQVLDTVPGAPYTVTDSSVLSSAPEERELYVDPRMLVGDGVLVERVEGRQSVPDGYHADVEDEGVEGRREAYSADRK